MEISCDRCGATITAGPKLKVIECPACLTRLSLSGSPLSDLTIPFASAITAAASPPVGSVGIPLTLVDARRRIRLAHSLSIHAGGWALSAVAAGVYIAIELALADQGPQQMPRWLLVTRLILAASLLVGVVLYFAGLVGCRLCSERVAKTGFQSSLRNWMLAAGCKFAASLLAIPVLKLVGSGLMFVSHMRLYRALAALADQSGAREFKGRFLASHRRFNRTLAVLLFAGVLVGLVQGRANPAAQGRFMLPFLFGCTAALVIQCVITARFILQLAMVVKRNGHERLE